MATSALEFMELYFEAGKQLRAHLTIYVHGFILQDSGEVELNTVTVKTGA